MTGVQTCALPISIFVRYGTDNAFSIILFFIAIPYDVLVAEGLVVRSK